MGVKDSFMNASIVEKVAMILLLCATFFSWMSFTTTEWGVSDPKGSYYGIWRTCSGTAGLVTCAQVDGTPLDWYAAFQAFSTFGFVLTNVSFFLIILYLFMAKCKGDKEVAMAVAITGFAAAVMWLIAVIIFGAEKEDFETTLVDIDLGFSFGLAIIGLICAAAGGVAMFASQGGATSPSG